MMEDQSQSEFQPVVKHHILASVARWIKNHKIISVTICFVLILLFELLTLPFGEVNRLRTVNPTETAFMREHAESSRLKGKAPRINQQWVPLSKISRDVINAVIVAEDGRFWNHGGFDWFEFKESFQRNIAEGRAARGGSTITQQLAKNLFLSSSKNPLRKLREWVLTWWMERKLTKARILEIYLNVIEWGDGMYGIETAAQSYFGKSAAEIGRDDAARLAAVIPSPKRSRPDSESSYIERRARMILSRMAARGM